MDTELIIDAFDACRDLIRVIQGREPDFDQELYAEMNAVQGRLPRISVDPRHGGIQEWASGYPEEDLSHRHISPLYGLYPGNSITPETTPELAAAAEKSIDTKMENGYDGHGWCLGWIACALARLRKPEKAYAALEKILQGFILPNLMINSFGQPQVSDAQAVPAAMLEMLAQSRNGEILLLPALPAQWPDGRVRGLRLHGGYALDMEWKDQKLVRARLDTQNSFREMTVRVLCEGSYTLAKQDFEIIIEPEIA